jgi:AAA domain-containing protein/TIR domain-containing protein
MTVLSATGTSIRTRALRTSCTGASSRAAMRSSSTRGISIGTEWAREIQGAIGRARFFVVLLSAEAIRSDMLRQEVVLAHERRQGGSLTILPVRMDFTGDLSYDLASYLNPLQYALWRAGEPFASVIEEVRRAIESSEGLSHEAVGEADAPALAALHTATDGRGAPLPAVDPRLIAEAGSESGAVGLDLRFYVRRAADQDLENRIKSPRGITATVRGARQMGKSSLLARAHAAAAVGHGQAVAYIDFQLIDRDKLCDLDSLLRYLAARLARTLKTARKPEDYWDPMFGAKDSLTEFVEDAVLNPAAGQVSLLFDEADRVFDQSAYCDDFFGTLRAWTNRRATHRQWAKLNLVIAHSTEPGLWIQDLNQSPFNVGFRFELGDLSPAQVHHLNGRYGGVLSDPEVGELYELIGGQPFLVRQALYTLRTQGGSWRELASQAIAMDGPFGDHLRRLSWVLSQQPGLRHALLEILRDRTCADERDFQRLHAAGLVAGPSRMRCSLYARYLDKGL